MMQSIIPIMIISNRITITIPIRAPAQGGKLETSSKIPLAKIAQEFSIYFNHYNGAQLTSVSIRDISCYWLRSYIKCTNFYRVLPMKMKTYPFQHSEDYMDYHH